MNDVRDVQKLTFYVENSDVPSSRMNLGAGSAKTVLGVRGARSEWLQSRWVSLRLDAIFSTGNRTRRCGSW
jgi:hypothetical protein